MRKRDPRVLQCWSSDQSKEHYHYGVEKGATRKSAAAEICTNVQQSAVNYAFYLVKDGDMFPDTGSIVEDE